MRRRVAWPGRGVRGEARRPLSPWRTAVLGAAALALGAFGWWTASPLVLNDRVAEAAPGAADLRPLYEGQFRGADSFHRVSGTVRVLRQQGNLILRLEDDFRSINGPDLHVWLVRGEEVSSGYLEVAPLKGNLGGQNYVLPAGTDVSGYTQVFIWCRAFRQLFGAARLAGVP